MTAQPPSPTESTTYFFNARELARLAVYRAAVVARFYTDQCAPADDRPEFDPIRLLDAAGAEQRAA